MAADSAELAEIAAEAKDIGKKGGGEDWAADLVLATFAVPGAADVLLRERGCGEDQVLAELAAVGAAPEEPQELFAQALEKARQLADDCGSDRAEGLHLLVALTRLSKSAAAQLLEKTAAPLASLRTTALGFLTGSVPRRKEVALAPPQTPPAALAQRAPQTERVTTLPPSTSPLARAIGGTHVTPHSEARPGDVPESKWSLDPRVFPWLTSHGRNLTQLAADKRLDPAVGREREIEELLDILGKRRSNNPVLVGEPGVGKTAIVEGLAQRMLDLRDVDRILVELDVSSLVAGAPLRGAFRR